MSMSVYVCARAHARVCARIDLLCRPIIIYFISIYCCCGY